MPDIDVLILTALKEEFDAVQTVFQTDWQRQDDVHGFLYATTRLPNGLKIALARSATMGGTPTAITASRLITELTPQCLAMCGICAGRRGKVSLGDVIVADRVYKYDSGKTTAEGTLLQDITTYNLDPRWKQAAENLPVTTLTGTLGPRPVSSEHQTFWILKQLHDPTYTQPLTGHPERKERCPDWTRSIQQLEGQGLIDVSDLALTDKGRQHIQKLLNLYPDGLEDAPFAIHVGPLACGDRVIEDDTIFAKLETAVRGVLGLEMEGAAIGLVAEQMGISLIVVKSVCDFADPPKKRPFPRLRSPRLGCIPAPLPEPRSHRRRSPPPTQAGKGGPVQPGPRAG